MLNARPLKIGYECKDFEEPLTPLADGKRDFDCSWGDLLWAALTVGRPDLYHVFRHGRSSYYEALFRITLIRMALEERHSSVARFGRTAAAESLDPTEKGMVNYFLGMAVCKMFAARLLDAPWALHVDVFRDRLPFVVSQGSRPDLMAQAGDGRWHSFESKGRAAPPATAVKDAAKAQAEQFRGYSNVDRCVGSIAFFEHDILRVYWVDPPAESGKERFVVDESDWRHYYAMVAAMLKPTTTGADVRESDNLVAISHDDLDLQLEVDGEVARLLRDQRWGMARRTAVGRADDLRKAGFQADGIRVIAGKSWAKPFEDWRMEGR